MKFIKYILLFLISVPSFLMAQNEPSPFQVWRLTNYSGEVRLRGTYRESSTNHDIFSKDQKDTYLNGLLHLNTRSFFIHPNFMLVNVDATYNPMTRKENYIGVPDLTEKYASEGVEGTALFFSQKKIRLLAHGNLNHSLQNVENISRIKTKSKQYGAAISYVGSFMPMTIGYTKQNLEQQTIGNTNSFNLDQTLYQVNANKSFSNYDQHSLSYLRTENKSVEQSSLPNPEKFLTNSTIDLFELNDNIELDEAKKYTFTSDITNSNERGSFFLKRFYARENLTIKLPQNLVWSTNYHLGLTEMEDSKINYNAVQTSLSHKLYKSLDSKIYYEYNKTDQTAYDENRNKGGIDLFYTKKIPGGKLSLGYNFYRESVNVKSPPVSLRVLRAEYQLKDNEIVLLKNQNIDISSIIVRDITGTLIYQINFDYILIDRNPYVEIVRIPGGQIANNATVYVDYTAVQPGLYNYNLNSNYFSADLLIFENKLDLYYRTSRQDYTNSSQAENLVLNYFTRNIIGARVDFYYAKAGVEYDSYNSTILPYRAYRYFLSLQKMYKKLSFIANANYQNTLMTDENEKREDLDLSGKIAYSLFANTKLDFDYMYRSMKGRGIDVDLTTSKLELTSTLHKLYVSIGTEIYWYKDHSNQVHFKGVYLQLTRNF